ncbi:restriction endonuclease [Paenibacillus aestuarii]|uniref:Restriction endonuclease n=1 Tax=Paenibacillus aestuarii TaxID=516965 RepID=A0ABW0KGQ4_9BACL|nr:restriction endonuclease [Paenibacillus aestuarii]
MRLTADDIVRAIGKLPKDITYYYVNSDNPGHIQIVDVVLPEGPIYIKRWNPIEGGNYQSAATETISSQLIWRIANAFMPGHPINFDRVLGGSYNTRSVLEALLAHTPYFYYCRPGRIEVISNNSKIKKGHKHLMWLPEQPHEMGRMVQAETEMVISEIPTEVVYDALVVPAEAHASDMSEMARRRHSQIQIALIEIGEQLGFRTWVAQNDKGITYKNQKIGEMKSVISSLRNDKTVISAWEEAQRAARLIDCIWFKNGKLMPAVMEVEHSTGVTSGLTRMKGLQDALPPFPTRYVIVAPDEERDKVFRESNRPQFQTLDTKYFSYSAVEELYSLCKRRKIRGVTEEFLDCFMEPTLERLA